LPLVDVAIGIAIGIAIGVAIGVPVDEPVSFDVGLVGVPVGVPVGVTLGVLLCETVALDVIVGLGLGALETILLLLHDSSSRWPRLRVFDPLDVRLGSNLPCWLEKMQFSAR
jgi:hypothetical protein